MDIADQNDIILALKLRSDDIIYEGMLNAR
jgi:hypothetical protein